MYQRVKSTFVPIWNIPAAEHLVIEAEGTQAGRRADRSLGALMRCGGAFAVKVLGLWCTCLALSATVLVAQGTLPHTMAPHERDLIAPYRASRAELGRGTTSPPSFPVRTMAEWEEVESLVIVWTGFPGILKQIVRHALPQCRVIIVCDDQADVESFLAEPDFGGAIEDVSGITYLNAAFNSIWSRDYFAESIYANEVDSLLLLDWIYNRPRPADDELSDAVGTAEGISVIGTTSAPYDLVHTGGNFMCDGAGTAFSSELVLDENGPQGEFNQTVRDASGVNSIMEQFMGIHRYITMPTLPFDGIHHIDMHMKLLDEETLLIGEFPTGQSDGPQLEQNLATIMANETSVFGSPYRVVRIPMPPSTSGGFPPNASYRTFANNVFINRTVLVPTYRTEYDTIGLRILSEALPGYEIVGIDCDSEQNIIQLSGAIHCITKTIGVRDPLLIRHQPLDDTDDLVGPYMVDAYIRHRSGIADAQLYWALTPEGPFTMVPLSAMGDDHWSAGIPGQAPGSEVYYYVAATANSGKQQVRPLVAPDGAWHFKVFDLANEVVATAAPIIAEVFPNPASTVVWVQLARTVSGSVRVELLDALGRSAMQVYNGVLPADGRLFIDLADLPNAPYLVQVTTAQGRATTRLVKR